jgi:tetratricopeptide (TPR) repeat protein
VLTILVVKIEDTGRKESHMRASLLSTVSLKSVFPLVVMMVLLLGPGVTVQAQDTKISDSVRPLEESNSQLPSSLQIPPAGSAEDATRLKKEAEDLRDKSGSKEDREKAVRKYKQALTIYEKLGDSQGVASVYTGLGILYSYLGQYDEGENHFEKSLSLSRETKDRSGEANALNNLGNVWKARCRYEKAVDYYEKSLAIKREIGDVVEVALTLNNLGGVYNVWGQYAKAVAFYEKSLAIGRETDNPWIQRAALNNLGIVYKDWGRYARAMDYFEKSLEIRSGVTDSRSEAGTLNNLGIVYKELGQYQKAVECFEKSLIMGREMQDPHIESASLSNLGVVYSAWGKNSEVVHYYEKSLAIDRKVGDSRGEAGTINNLGEIYRHQGRYDKAVEFYEKSLSLARETGDLKRQSYSLDNLGLVYSNWGQFQKALIHHHEALAICRKLGDLKGESYSLKNLGSVCFKSGRFPEAVSYFQEALEIARKIGSLEGQLDPLNGLGLVYSNCGQYGKAVEYYEASLRTARKIGVLAGELSPLTNLGNVYRVWGEYGKALGAYQQLFEIAQKLGSQIDVAAAIGNIGTIYADRGEYGKASECYNEALAIMAKLGEIQEEGRILMSLGMVCEHRGASEQALKNYEDALTSWSGIGVPTNYPKDLIGNLYLDKGDLTTAERFIKEAGYNSSLARLSLSKSQYTEARSLYEKVLRFAQKCRCADSLFTAHTGLGTALERMGDNKSAALHFRKAVEIIENLRTSLDPSQRETFFDVKINGFSRTAPYEGLARVLLKLKRPAESAKWTEYTKARLFAEAISKRGEYAGLNIPEDIREKDALLNDRLSALSNNLQKAYEKGNKEVIDSLEPQVKDAKEKLAAHVEMLRKEYPLFAATRYPQPMDLENAALKDDEWVVEYDVTDSDLLIYLIRGKNLVKAVRKEISRKDLKTLVKKFRQSFDGVTEDNLGEKLQTLDFQAGEKLATILLSDVLPELPKDVPVIVIPDDCLGVIPFEMLVINQGGKISTSGRVPQTADTEFLGDRNPVSYYQSITALTLTRTLGSQGENAGKLLVMADPVFGKDDPRITRLTQKGPQDILDKTTEQVIMSAKVDNHVTWSRLPRTRELGESLKKTYPKVTDVLEGFRASKTVFLQTDLHPYRSIVFATHGYGGSNLGGLQEPVLVLTLVNQPPGQDGFLRMTEVMGKKLNADIVALTGCETGLGRRISGEGTMNMGRAFQYAGAKSVLMSLWSVEQGASVKLVESFFKHLKEGKSKLEALRMARQEIRQAGFDHPFFWAPFILVGEVR